MAFLQAVSQHGAGSRTPAGSGAQPWGGRQGPCPRRRAGAQGRGSPAPPQSARWPPPRRAPSMRTASGGLHIFPGSAGGERSAPAVLLSPAAEPRLPGCRWGRREAPASHTAAWAGRAQRLSVAAAAGAPQAGFSPPTPYPRPPRAMAGSSSLEAVRRKIRSLQEQADAAEERAGSLQRELDYERKLRETVRNPPRPSSPSPGRTWRTWASWRAALG